MNIKIKFDRNYSRKMLDNRMFFELNGTDYTEVEDDADIAVFTLINDYSKQVDILVNKSKIYLSMEIWNV